jgi:hypothetical protein
LAFDELTVGLTPMEFLAGERRDVVTNYSVNCMMCGRASGQVRHGVFYRALGAPPLENRDGRSRCGFCSGNLYLEPDDSILTAPQAAAEAARDRRLAS